MINNDLKNWGRCKGCGAQIQWIKTEKKNNMPAEIKETTIITDEGVVVKGFIPHWVSCPAAEKIREDKKQEEISRIYLS